MNTRQRIVRTLCLAAFLAIVGAPFSGRGAEGSSAAGAEMAEAASHFLAALNAEQKAKAQFEWKDEERFNWHFIPRDRKGLPIKEMNPAQRQLAEALIASALSRRGLMKAVTIMSLEQVLHELEGANRRFARDPELYFVSVFGQPGPQATWGWRLEGHHLAFNFTIVKGAYFSGTPSFLGSNPAQIKSGPRQGLRALAAEEDLGRELVRSLTAEQRATAVIAEKAPADIITGAARKVEPLEKSGIAASKLDDKQMALLKALIQEYSGRLRPDAAESDWKRIVEAGFKEVYFVWAGGMSPGDGHYYRVQGPTFLLEYDCTQNGGNHVHAVWRDFNGDFGEDLLRQHYQDVAHR